MTLRLDEKLWEAIDRERLTSSGEVNRNEWIRQACREKLERDSADDNEHNTEI